MLCSDLTQHGKFLKHPHNSQKYVYYAPSLNPSTHLEAQKLKFGSGAIQKGGAAERGGKVTILWIKTADWLQVESELQSEADEKNLPIGRGKPRNRAYPVATVT